MRFKRKHLLIQTLIAAVPGILSLYPPIGLTLPDNAIFTFFEICCSCLILPGMMIAIILVRNVHDFPLWLAGLANFALYFLLARTVGSILAKRRAARRNSYNES